jgi:hypothetical protein
MSLIYTKAVFSFFVAFGVVMGGALLAGVGAVFVWAPPREEMLRVAGHLKIWALVAAVGGSIDPMRVIESNVMDGHLSLAVQQIGYILCGFLGAHIGTELIQWMCKNGG